MACSSVWKVPSNDGVIFISIDDNEVANLRKICNEVFGEENFFCQVVVQSNKRGQTYKQISKTHEYLLVFTKSPSTEFNELEKNDDNNDLNLEDDIGKFNIRELRNRNPKFGRFNRPGLFYPIYVNSSLKDEDGFYPVSIIKSDEYKEEVYPLNSQGDESCWRWGKELAKSNIQENTRKCNLVAKQKRDGGFSIYEKYRKTTYKAKSIWDEIDVITEKGTVELGELGLAKYFDFPKPLGLLKKSIEIGLGRDGIILDFFSGSATAAHAVMQLNAEDGGNRRFLMVQLPEPCPEDSEASKAGYKNICEIGKERIRRAGEKIKAEVEEQNAQLRLDEKPKKVPDIGFEVFKLDSSNLKKWNTEAGMVKDYADGSEQLDFSQKKLAEDLQAAVENYIPGRTEQDVVYEILLKMGFDLTWPVEEKVVAGKKVYVVALGALMLCLENNITPDVARGMAELHKQLAPETWKVVFRDNGFASDSDKVNVHEILKSAGLEEDAFTTV